MVHGLRTAWHQVLNNSLALLNTPQALEKCAESATLVEFCSVVLVSVYVAFGNTTVIVVSDSSSSTDCALLELWAVGICPLPETNGSEQHFSFAIETLVMYSHHSSYGREAGIRLMHIL